MGSIISYLSGGMLTKILVNATIGLGLLFAGAKLIKIQNQIKEHRHQQKDFKEREALPNGEGLGYIR